MKVRLECRREVEVNVNIDKPGRDVETVARDDLFCLGRFDGRSDLGDLVAQDGDIHLAIDVVFRVEDMPAFEQQVVRLGGEQSGDGEKKHWSCHRRYSTAESAIGLGPRRSSPVYTRTGCAMLQQLEDSSVPRNQKAVIARGTVTRNGHHS